MKNYKNFFKINMVVQKILMAMIVLVENQSDQEKK